MMTSVIGIEDGRQIYLLHIGIGSPIFHDNIHLIFAAMHMCHRLMSTSAIFLFLVVLFISGAAGIILLSIPLTRILLPPFMRPQVAPTRHDQDGEEDQLRHYAKYDHNDEGNVPGVGGLFDVVIEASVVVLAIAAAGGRIIRVCRCIVIQRRIIF